MNERKRFSPDMLPRRARYLARERTLIKRIRRCRRSDYWTLPNGWDWDALVAACRTLQKTGDVDKAFDVYLVSVTLMEGI